MEKISKIDFLKSEKAILFFAFGFLFLLPILESLFFGSHKVASILRPVLIFSLLGLGLSVLTGFTGLLNLGVAAFMAIGAYTFAICSCSIYPFQLGFWGSLAVASIFGAIFGFLIGVPTLRLRGDYLAIVTLAFGEITQDCLRNLDLITKGTQGINPIPGPNIFGSAVTSEIGWFYLLLFLVGLCFLAVYKLVESPTGRAWSAIGEDELAASCLAIAVARYKLHAFCVCAALCALAGALWASFLGTSGEPSNYDFQVSILALSMVIVGGLGSLSGVLVGAIIMVGLNSVVLVELTNYLSRSGIGIEGNVFLTASNWKYLLFGSALLLMIRLKPDGIMGRQGRGEC